MDRNNTPTLLVPLLALLAILFPFAAAVRSPSSPAQTTPQTKQLTPDKREGKLPQYGAASLIENFLHARNDRKTGWICKDPRSTYSLHFMIATVPDPVDSSLPYFFDSFLDSIQRAFEADGYVLDRYHLAWSEPPPKTAETAEANQPDNTPRYRWRPSLLLFRKPVTDTDVQEKDLYLVFLVGETPTSGIHKAAMGSALRQIGEFFPWGLGYKTLPDELHELNLESSTITIMGPTFSGSAISLEFALRDWLGRIPEKLGKLLPKFTIVSGTATAMDSEDFSDIGAGDTFHAVVPRDRDTIKPILKYIRSLGKLKERSLDYARIALLTEANTAYGRQNLCEDKSQEKSEDNCHVINLPFPMHISELRTASEKQRQKMSSPMYSNPTPPIPIEEGQSSRPKEIPPSYSDLEVSSAELVLSKLLSTISHEGYHAVGIMATDVRDTIFLAREIHLHCPGTLVFTLNSDLFYMHPDVSTSTRGMLVFTPYPLFNLDQVWTLPSWGQTSRLQFPSQAAEGVYNATLALLGQEWRMLDYGKPFSTEGQETTEEPALWVTAVGRNGPLPIRLLNWDSDHGAGPAVKTTNANHAADTESNHYPVIRKPPSPKPDDLPPSPTIDQEGVYTPTSAFGIALLGVVVLAFSWMIIREYCLPGSLNSASRLFGEPFTKDYQPKARLFLFACLVCLLSFYLLLNVAYFLPKIAFHNLDILAKGSQFWITLILTASLLSLIGAVIVIFFAFWKRPWHNTLLKPWVIATIFSGCSLVLIFSLLLAKVWLQTAWAAPTEAIFTYVRAFAFTSGLSPLVPLFCVALAGFLWAFSSFWRLRMIDGMRSQGVKNRRKNCLLRASTHSFRGVIKLETNVHNLLEKASVFPAKWYIYPIIVVLFFAMYLYFFFLPFVPSYEGNRFYFLFGWAFLLVLVALTIEFFRLCLAWRALRRLLQRLEVHPMQAAFERYHKKFPGLPRIDLTIPLRVYAVLSFSVEQAEQLLRLASSLASPVAPSGNATAWFPFTSSAVPGTVLQNLNLPKVQKSVQAAATDLSEALKYNAIGNWRLAIKKRSQCQQALGDLYQRTVQILEPSWRPQTTSAKVSPDFQAFCQLGEEFLVGRTVLLLSYVLPSLRNLGALILSGLLLMLFSVISYPFLQRNRFLAFNWVVILGFVGLALMVMLQMERDAVISALNGTKPGQVTLTRQFTFRFLTYVMVPILALLGAQFPDTVGQIISWFNSTPGH